MGSGKSGKEVSGNCSQLCKTAEGRKESFLRTLSQEPDMKSKLCLQLSPLPYSITDFQGKLFACFALYKICFLLSRAEHGVPVIST